MASQKRPFAYDQCGFDEPNNTKRLKPDSKIPDQAVEDIMAAIYFDINCVCTFREIVRSTQEAVDLTWYAFECNKAGKFVKGAAAIMASQVSPPSDTIDERIRDIVELAGWMIFAICVHSEAFRRSCVEAEPLVWELLMDSIWENESSIEVFARSRNLDWRGPLLTQSCHDLPDLHAALGPMQRLSDEHPHHFVQTQNRELRYPTHKGHIQTHVDHCIFNPTHWKPGRSDPTLRRPGDGTCHLCKVMWCDCILASLAGNLVELVEYEKKGTGVRALANFKDGDILDQYVGELRHRKYRGDRVYALEHPEHPRVSYIDRAVAVISPKRYGNWTRFINHSCNPSTRFVLRTVGKRTIMAIQAQRGISFGEEITIDYGDGYWSEREKCHCGEVGCRSNM